MAKKAANGSGTIRKKVVVKNGKKYIYYEARYTDGTDPGTGKQRQISISGKTQKEVSKKLKAATVAVDQGIHVSGDDITVSEWLDIWQSTFLVSQKESTKEKYQRDIDNHIKPGIGAIKLKDLNTETIQKFYNSLELAPKTIKNIHGTLHKALGKAKNLKKIAFNPSDDCELERPPKHIITPLMPEELKRYISFASSDPIGNMLIFLAFTGLRRNEIIGLPWDAVNFKDGSVTIKQQIRFFKGGHEIVTTKSRNVRKLYPAPIAMDALKAEKEHQQEMLAEADGMFYNEHNLVFTNELGRYITMSMLCDHNKKVLKAAGISDHRLHDLRDTFAVTTLQAGDDVKTVQENLGHADAAFTLNVYIASLENMRKKSASNMQQFYDGISAEKGEK